MQISKENSIISPTIIYILLLAHSDPKTRRISDALASAQKMNLIQ